MSPLQSLAVSDMQPWLPGFPRGRVCCGLSCPEEEEKKAVARESGGSAAA